MGNEITLSGAAAAFPFANGRFDLRGVWFPATTTSATPNTDLFVATTPEGELRLSFETDRLRMFVRGTNVLNTTTVALNPAEGTFRNWSAGDQVEWRAWYYPDLKIPGGYGVRMSVNGCGGKDTAGTPTGSALATATALTIQGRSEIWGALTHGTLTDELSPSALTSQACDIVLVGDSIVAPRGTEPCIGTYLFSGFNRRGLRIHNQAQGGAQIGGATGQTERWNAGPNKGSRRARVVVIQCGVNNIAANFTGEQVIALLKTLIAAIRKSNPRAKIVLCTITPARTYSGMGTTRHAQWTVVNNAIIARQIDCDAVVDTRSLGDVTGALLTAFDVGDHLHTNNAGRRENSRLICVVLQALGLIG